MRRGAYRWVVVVLVTAIMFINYIDRSAIGYAAGPLMQALRITPVQWGLLTSTFAIGYLIFNFVGGMLVDRLGPRAIGTVSGVLWAVSSLLIGMSTGLGMLVLARAILGIAEGPGFPTAARAVGQWLPQHEQGRAISLYTGLGVPFSLLVGAPLVTSLIAFQGWRFAFYALAASTLVWVVVWVALFRDSPSQHPRVGAEELRYIESGRVAARGDDKSVPWHVVFTNKALVAMFFAYFGWGYAYWTFVYWLPAHLFSAYHIDILHVGMLSSLPWLAATITTLAGGWFVDRLYRRTGSKYRSRSLVLGVCMALTALCMLPVIFEPTLFNAILSVTLGMGIGWFAGACFWLIPIDALPERPALATGFITTGTALAGITSPVITGWLIEQTGSFHTTFMVMMALLFISALLVLCFVRFDETPGARGVANPMMR
ncbi:MFS transporter [Paraburkholderia sp.]|uniref:MFS transporter n=1 Tax=Paraburkholderia sp. TaxID=1926495 RepID=UPI0039E70463